MSDAAWGAIAVIVAAFFTYLGTSDRRATKRNTERISDLEAAHAACLAAHEKCEEDNRSHQRDIKRMDELGYTRQEQINELQRRVIELQNNHRRGH